MLSKLCLTAQTSELKSVSPEGCGDGTSSHRHLVLYPAYALEHGDGAFSRLGDQSSGGTVQQLYLSAVYSF